MRLSGIEGSHLLGFMAALGVMSLLDQRSQRLQLTSPRMRFSRTGLAEIDGLDVEDVALAGVLLDELQPVRSFLDGELSLVEKPSDFTRATFGHAAEASHGVHADFLAGLACCIADEGEPSTLCAANGAGHQNMIRSMRDILALLEEQHLHDALFAPWQYEYSVPGELRKRLKLGDRKPTLRLDPADERLYALRLNNPTTANDFRTELGAQALAIPAFRLLPVVPSPQPLAVASRKVRNSAWFQWPLWEVPATLASARSLVCVGARADSDGSARGVFARFRVARVSGDKGRYSFSPSDGIWWDDPLVTAPESGRTAHSSLSASS